MYKLCRCSFDWNNYVKEYKEVNGIVNGILWNDKPFTMSKDEFDSKYYQNRPIYEEE